MEGNKIVHLMTPKRSISVNYYINQDIAKKSQDFKVFLNFKQLLKRSTFF